MMSGNPVTGLAVVLAQENPEALRDMRFGPGGAVHKERLRPGFAVDGFRSDNRNRQHAQGRIARARIHDVAVYLPIGLEEFFVGSGSRERLVFQIDLGGRYLLGLRIANPDVPSLLSGGGAHGINAAAGGADESRMDAGVA